MASRALSWAGPIVGFIVAFFAVRALTPEHRVPNAPVQREAIMTDAVESEAADLVALQSPSDAVPPPPLRAVEPTLAAPADTTPEAPQATSRDVGVLVHGTVANGVGEPLDEAYVVVEMPTGDRVVASSDELGRYALGPLPAGRWIVTASLQNHHAERVEVDLTSDLGMARQDLVLRPQQVVRVRIETSAGEPSIPALVAAGHFVSRIGLVPVATREDPGSTFTEVTGSLNNTFGIGSFGQPGFIGPDQKFPDEYGAVTLHVDGPAWISLVASHQVLAKQRVEPADEVVTFTLNPEELDALTATVRATVLDAVTGEPLEAKGHLGDDPFHNGETRSNTDASTGALVIEGTLPGRKWLIIDSAGRASVKREVDVARGAILELGEIVMHEPVSIRGSVTGADGTPLEAVVKWGVLDEVSGNVTWAAQTSAQSGPDGSFVIPRLEPAVYIVWSPGLPARSPRPHDASRASRAASVDARTQSVEDVELRLLPTSRITLVTGETGAPYAMARALDDDGLPARSIWLGRWGPEAPLDLVDGTYTLKVTRDGEELLRRTLEVNGVPQRIDVDL